ncbi:MAG: MFS transporter, partial [Nocardioidaceae bacterium]
MGALRDVARLPHVRSIEVAWGLSLVGGSSSTIALLIYSYAEGGATLLAIYSVGRALAGAVATLIVSSLGDRVRRDRLLRATTSARTVLVLSGALLAMGGGPGPLVIGLAVVSSGCSGTFRPLQAGALPWLVRTPAELASANVGATLMENAGALLGPFLAGVVLLLADPGAALAMSAGWLALAALALLPLRLPDESRHVGAERVHVLRDAAAGTKSLVRVASPGGLVVLAFAQTFARGVLLVGLVVFAFDVLGLDNASIGWFNAVMGLGGLLGWFLG